MGGAWRNHVGGKYLSNPIEANVVFLCNANPFRATMLVHVEPGVVPDGNGEAHKPHPAFDAAAGSVARRLRRCKRRLRDHRTTAATAVGLLPPGRCIPRAETEGVYVDSDDTAARPVIVADMPANVEILAAGEAVLRANPADMSAILLRNRLHGGPSSGDRHANRRVGCP